MNRISCLCLVLILLLNSIHASAQKNTDAPKKITASTNMDASKNKSRAPVDLVDPYIGNISHLLVPTYPTIQLPNSLLRVYPQRGDYTSNRINGLPLIITSHRGRSSFNLSFQAGVQDSLKSSSLYTYDNETTRPYYYAVRLDEAAIDVEFAPSHQSAIYSIKFDKKEDHFLVMNSDNGSLEATATSVQGFQYIDNSPTRVFIYMEVDRPASGSFSLPSKGRTGKSSAVALKFPSSVSALKIRYGISLISEEQAKKNLQREIRNYDLKAIAARGRSIWNEKLGKIKVSGSDEDRQKVFYTSLYRTYERMINISEDGRYYSAYDGKIHNDEGIPFYVDDWIWDTYRATHPLRVLIEPTMESHMVNSFVRMAEQMDELWMPTFPEVTGDSRRMNSNHGVATVLDAYVKGLKGFDIDKAYEACRNAITEKTLAPWSAMKAGYLDSFYKANGYIPALRENEKEFVKEVSDFEKRQPVAVTLGTAYDEWCLSQLASRLGKKEDYAYFSRKSYNYRNLFNPSTLFFHPKDASGQFIEPFDYRYTGGLGARNTYGENNGWIYRWDVQHNIGDLVALMGGAKKFSAELDNMYNTSLGKSKFDFFSQLPDHTGNVGQYSMANEPSLHIPYLYNYSGEPWKTQKRIHALIEQWFRNDLMGIPGDEDGGGMTAFVVFSMMGFYPVTPGMPMYVIGSPMFEKTEIKLGSNKTLQLVSINYSPMNKYIQSMKVDGKTWTRSWISHEELITAKKIEFVMGLNANTGWANNEDAVPPSFEMK